MLQELTNKIKKTLKDKEWTRLSLLEHGLKEYPEGYEHYEDIDINLEDVLRCLQISQPTSWFYVVTAYGRILSAVSNNLSNESITYEDTGIYWFLGKPLHEQSEETIKELNKLI